MTRAEYVAWMRSHIVYGTTAKTLAVRWGVSEAQLSLVMAGKRAPGPKLLKGTGFRLDYVRVSGGAE